MARWGDKGDEFVLLLRRPLSDAQAYLNMCISALSELQLEFEVNNTKRPLSATVSCVAAEFALDDDKDRIVEKSNRAMHRDKKQGKNRLVVFPLEPIP
jgi:GGDEF domain-containing protein